MKITLKLYAGLSDHLPPGAVRNALEIDVPDDASPGWVLERYRVPPEQAHLVLVNGVFAAPGDRDAVKLRGGDTLAVWPPVAGG